MNRASGNTTHTSNESGQGETSENSPLKKAQHYFNFLKAALSSPLGVGTIFPSGPYLASEMIRGLPLDSMSLIIEVGPGTGAITQPIYNHLKSPEQYLGIELSPQMIATLSDRFPRLKFVQGSAENLIEYIGGAGKADLVMSSLPWTLFSNELRKQTLSNIHSALKPGGKFITFICSNVLPFGPAKHFQQLMTNQFVKVETSPLVWRNIPPAYVYRCSKGEK